ncbi:MAG: hypothetical protein JNM55_15490 [Anaerolineales bacterium]|nr:hypothetical protein [Anaerolineales bacterium]
MNTIQITGLLGLLGAFVYAIGDVLLLAGKTDIEKYPKLKPFQKLLSDAEKMVNFSAERMMWGALIGVFATPLILAGFWQVYQGLAGGNMILRMIIIILFGIASVIGTFVHGSFFYMGEYVKALNSVSEESQQVITEMISRHRKVMIITYAPLLILIVIASILFSIIVGSGGTHFPTWMIAVNPVTLTILWLFLKRILPGFIKDITEGAGFNIAYFAFFLFTTMTLWSVQ